MNQKKAVSNRRKIRFNNYRQSAACLLTTALTNTGDENGDQALNQRGAARFLLGAPPARLLKGGPLMIDDLPLSNNDDDDY